MSQGPLILLVAVVLATAFGCWRALTDGRFRGTHRIAGATDLEPHPDVLGAADLDRPLGERATLVQFSSAFCAPCRATRRVLTGVAGSVPGVVYVEVDAEHNLDLVRRLGIMRTPTTLVLDAGGAEVARASGQPRTEQVLAAVAATAPP